MVAFNRFNQLTQDLAQKVHNFATDSLKVMLTNTLPVATNAIKANITDITAGNGYVAGGAVASIVSALQVSGVTRLILNNVTFTASGGSIGPFRYAVLYNDTPTSPAKPLIGWWDNGVAVTLATTETFSAGFDSTNGVLQLT